MTTRPQHYQGHPIAERWESGHRSIYLIPRQDEDALVIAVGLEDLLGRMIYHCPTLATAKQVFSVLTELAVGRDRLTDIEYTIDQQDPFGWPGEQ